MTRLTLSSVLAWLATVFVYLVQGLATAQTPTAEQLRIYQSLPASQQEALLEALREESRGTDSSSRSDERAANRAPGDEFTRRPDLPDSSALSLFSEERETRFKPGDTLLLSIEIRQFKDSDAETLSAMPVLQTEAGDSKTATSTREKTAAAQPREAIKRAESETKRLEDLRTRILRRNPLKLDKWGIVSLPELGAIPLAGLTPEEATKRMAAEPLLADFLVEVTYLPVKPVGVEALKPFGQELFKKGPSTFAPANDIPVPSEYIVGPGDTFEVQLVGNTRGRYSLVVRRDGQVSLPDLGAIAVGGMTFEEARTLLETQVSERLIGTQASVQMGRLRSIQVFVVGDARQPGSYTVSALSTITNALFVSGGVREIGSLRNIELKRNGQTVTRLDLYDLLLGGDTRADVRLMSGDVIFVPPVTRMAGITGEVRRPALYELKAEATAADLIRLAGGLTADADGARATVSHIDATRQRVVLDVDLTLAAATMRLANGDIVQVPEIRSTVQDSITVQGHVLRPGQFQYRTGLRVSDVINSLTELKPMADQHYVLIRREVAPTNRIEFVSVDLVKAVEQKGSDADKPLAPRDQIYVFDLESGRDRLMEPLLRELRLQSTREAPTAEVSISGRVNAPGQYPLEPGMRVSDLVRAGGSLNEAAYGGKAELTRNVVRNGEERKTELLEIDLARALAGNPTDDLELKPFDYLIIKELPLWGSQEYVEVKGEVRFPGRYPVARGETLRSVVQRAGGLTDLAFSEGAVFTRETLKERERKQVEDLKRRMQTDLAQVSLMAAQEAGGNAAQALSVGQQVLENLSDAEPVGRLVINLDHALAAVTGSAQDVVLKDGDKLMVPRITQEVTVIGEVQSPTSHLYGEHLGRNDYVLMSGGATQRADKSRIYVVRADGSVVGAAGNRWFSGDVDVRPGDTIVVPLDAERMRPLPLWTAVTQIIYYLAVSVAAVSSFN